MNWKVTAVFGVLLLAALAAYFFHAPADRTGGAGPRQNRLLPEVIADRVSRIDILRTGETVTSIERARDSVGDYWRIAPPVDKPVDLTLVREMLAGLDRFVKTGGMESGVPETAPEITGLAEPRLVVTFHGPGWKETLRFGRAPPTNSTAVFFQKAGDPKVYLASQEVFGAYDKPALALRQKQLLRFDPHKAVKATIRHKFLRGRPGQPALAEYETSTFEYGQGAEAGWWMIEPHRERLDDLKVKRLVTELAALPIEDWRPAGDLKEQGFHEPSDRISIWLHGAEKPIVILFGDDTDQKRKRFAHVEGGGEVARVDLKRYDQMPLQRSHFRPDIVFPFSRESVKTCRLEARDLGRVVIERREKKEESGVVVATWELVEPVGLKIEREKLEGFVGSMAALRILSFLGEQDFKVARLDPADVTLTLETRDGRSHVCHFTGEFMRREGIKEVFAVQPEMVQIMRRLELNFLHAEIFNIPRDSIREFTFDSKADLVLYTARFEAEQGKWKFSRPPELAGKEPNPNLMNPILNVMNYVQAAAFIARDPASLAEHRLDDRVAPSILTVVHDGGKAVFYVSENKSDRPNRPIYYARREGSSVIFQISGDFVELLKRLAKP